MSTPRLPELGKNKGGRPKGCADSVQRKLREDGAFTLPVQAKCPACGKMHRVPLTVGQMEIGKLQRIYCEQHLDRRYFSGDLYQLPGHQSPRRAANE